MRNLVWVLVAILVGFGSYLLFSGASVQELIEAVPGIEAPVSE